MSGNVLRRSTVLSALLFSVPVILGAQTVGIVRGRVVESGGQPVPDAQVMIMGTRLSALTGSAGDFTISGVPTGPRELSARRLGFQAATRSITVAQGTNEVGDIALSASAVNLSEIVVTGTGTATERRKLGTSIATVDSAAISRAEA